MSKSGGKFLLYLWVGLGVAFLALLELSGFTSFVKNFIEESQKASRDALEDAALEKLREYRKSPGRFLQKSSSEKNAWPSNFRAAARQLDVRKVCSRPNPRMNISRGLYHRRGISLT